ncbi:MAG: TlyA family RNA methyltransferase [Gammaproteobacteria bacterium]|nr:TlyA family RNA methyltransferase [Gammaproteobacteria bacterium]MBU1414428.1 TlyA family RNA methyltransferase [Gammaproteobacteria bacterium]
MKSFHRRTSRPAPQPAVVAAPVVHRDGLRADQLLVECGLAPSRTVAQRLIESGRVSWSGGLIAKVSMVLPENAELAVADDENDRYVSRGGIKLAGALAHTKLDVRGRLCLDVGQSTGGFTDCLLQAGATSVVGVDVGHGQLHPKLAGEPRVTGIEGVNARELQKSAVATRHYDLIVADLSFISLTLVLPQLPALLAEGGDMLLLVKPQFEVGPTHVGNGGIVRDAALYPQVEAKLRRAAEAADLRVVDYFDSPIAGTDGNREFFIWTKP